MQNDSAFPASSPGKKIHLRLKSLPCLKKGTVWVMTDLVLSEFEIHALALCIDSTPDLSRTQWVQVECGPQPEIIVWVTNGMIQKVHH